MHLVRDVLIGAVRLVARHTRWLIFLLFFSLPVSPQLNRCGARGTPFGDCCWSTSMVLFRNFARLPSGCCWSSMCRRVSMLLLMGAQLFTAVLFQSSIVLGPRGWPCSIVTSSDMMFGKSLCPAPVVSCIQINMFPTASHPSGHIVSRSERLE